MHHRVLINCNLGTSIMVTISRAVRNPRLTPRVGNGTHLSFEDDPSVLYVSLHRHEGGKFYPYGSLGGMKSCGTERGRG